jgi:D-glycero-D-manno-heptose 1,7-bisphosphate phosphatase
MIVDDIGLWCQIGSAACAGRPALFLDRDGVIVEDTHYLGRAEDLRMIAGAAAAIARCNGLGIPVVMVTNQSGIARGYYDWNGFCAVQDALFAALAAAGGHLDAVLACAYHADGLAALRVAGHPWRKPNPGMILEAGSRMQLDLTRSWIVGDRVHDLNAGMAAGLAGGTLVSSHGGPQDVLPPASSRFSVATAPDLAAAVAALIERGRLSNRASS